MRALPSLAHTVHDATDDNARELLHYSFMHEAAGQAMCQAFLLVFFLVLHAET